MIFLTDAEARASRTGDPRRTDSRRTRPRALRLFHALRPARDSTRPPGPTALIRPKKGTHLVYQAPSDRRRDVPPPRHRDPGSRGVPVPGRVGSSVQWQRLTWRQVGDRVTSMRAVCDRSGLTDEQRVGIICGTRIDSILVDLGIMCGGGTTTTVYPSSTGEDAPTS